MINENSKKQKKHRSQDQDYPAGHSKHAKKTPKDCGYNAKLEGKGYFLSDEDALLLDRDDSPNHLVEDDNDLNCMDFEQ